MKRDSIIVINETDFIPSELGDELVIMNLQTGDFIGLNHVGNDIWKLIQKPKTIDSVIQELLEIYSTTEEKVIEADVLEFLTNLSEHKVVNLQ